MYAAIHEMTYPGSLAATAVCDVLELSRSGYYAWRQGIPSQRAERDAKLTPLVRAIFWKHKRRYGARRIASELADLGEVCSPRRVAKIMKIQRLRAIQPKSFVPKTTQSRHGLGYSPNLLLHAPPPVRTNEVWVADITYIPLRTGDFAYLALVMDLFSRRVLGWDLAALMTETLVLEALRQAIGLRQPPPNVIHHSDRGGQYAGAAYRAVLRRAAMRQSMSRADECTDNAFMESCFGTIKTELEMTEYDHVPHARAEIGPYLNYYNLERRHSSLRYLSPIQFEALNNAPH